MNKIDFEHAGLEFVAGDRFSSGIGLPTIVMEFAWRTNTGVKPEFDGVIEIEWSDGCKEVAHSIGVANWGVNLEHDSFAVKWRPHLPKVGDKPKSHYDVGAHVSEAKPIFTQAMADAGELPLVGSECFLHLAFNTYRAEITYMGDGVGCFKHLPAGKEFSFSVADTSFKPIQTEREKAIEEIAKVLSDDYCDVVELVKPLDCFMSQSKRLYDAGYRLQTPKNNVT